MCRSERAGALRVFIVAWTLAIHIDATALLAQETSAGSEPPPAADATSEIVRARGALEPLSRVEIQSEVGARVAIRHVVPEGKQVKKGTLLVELDASSLVNKREKQRIEGVKASAAVAEAELASSSARAEAEALVGVAEKALVFARRALEAFVSGSGEYRLELRSAESEIAIAEKQLELATRRLELVKQFAESPDRDIQVGEAELAIVVTTTRMEAAKAKHRFLTEHLLGRKTAELELGIAERKLELVRASNELAGSIKEGKASVAAAETAREQAVTRLERVEKQITACRIHAPADGTVIYQKAPPGARPRQPEIKSGATVADGQTILHIVDSTRFTIELEVPLSTAQAIVTGQSVKVRVDAFPDRVFDARIVAVRVVKERGRRPATEGVVTIRVDDTSGALEAGMAALVELELSSDE